MLKSFVADLFEIASLLMFMAMIGLWAVASGVV